MTAPVRIQTKERGFWFDELPEYLSAAVNEYNLPETKDWEPLAEISAGTIFEGIDVYGDSAIIDGKKLIAPATVYVKLQYDPSSDEPILFNDSYPASVFFKISDQNGQKIIEINKVDIDNSSFYE